MKMDSHQLLEKCKYRCEDKEKCDAQDENCPDKLTITSNVQKCGDGKRGEHINTP